MSAKRTTSRAAAGDGRQVRGVAERPRGALGKREARDAAALAAGVQRRRFVPRADQAGQQRLGRPASARPLPIAAAIASGPVSSVGACSATTASTPWSSCTARERLAVRLRARRREHVDRVRDARVRRKERRQAGPGRVAERGDLERRRLARVGAEDAEAAGVGDDRDPAARRHRLVREQPDGVEQLLDGVGTDDAGLAEQGVDRDLLRRQRRGVRRGRAGAGACCARPSPPRSACARSRAGRCARTCAGCRTTRRRARSPSLVGSSSHALEQVVRRYVGAVADRDERRDADAEARRLLEQRDADRARLGGDGDVAGRRAGAGERGVVGEPGPAARGRRGSSARPAGRWPRGSGASARPPPRRRRATTRRSPPSRRRSRARPPRCSRRRPPARGRPGRRRRPGRPAPGCRPRAGRRAGRRRWAAAAALTG